MHSENNPVQQDAALSSGSFVSRRGLMQGSAALVTAHLAGVAAAQSQNATVPASSAEVALRPDRAVTLVPVRLEVNGQSHALTLDSRTTVLDALRENLGLKGTKKGCDHGQCGACTVLIDGRRSNACLSLAVMHDGQAITTIEGLSRGDELHPMQAAFLHHDGFQCGYCTPGQICSAVGMLAEARAGMPSYATVDLQSGMPALSDEEIRERMSGNLCRCSAYPNIVAAIRDVAAARAGAGS